MRTLPASGKRSKDCLYIRESRVNKSGCMTNCKSNNGQNCTLKTVHTVLATTIESRDVDNRGFFFYSVDV